MISISDRGRFLFEQVIYAQLKTIHLLTATGELEAHGYAPKDLDPEQWADNEYPPIRWEFSAGDPVNVTGWAIKDAFDKELMRENFQEPQLIQHTGDKITVNILLRVMR